MTVSRRFSAAGSGQHQPTRSSAPLSDFGNTRAVEGILILNKVFFALVIHSHQPVGNFDHVIEEAYRKSYLPFAQILLKHPRVRLSLHYSGILLEWLEVRHPEYFDQLRELLGRGQVELLGGGYYEPILPSIPDSDKVAQIRKLADYLTQHWGKAPRGAWVAERVWEPSLARPLAEAGVEYVLLDDTHFLAAGLEPARLHGIYITEEQGAPLRLVPSLKSFRYTIPFREPEETVRILREGRNNPANFLPSETIAKNSVYGRERTPMCTRTGGWRSFSTPWKRRATGSKQLPFRITWPRIRPSDESISPLLPTRR